MPATTATRRTRIVRTGGRRNAPRVNNNRRPPPRRAAGRRRERRHSVLSLFSGCGGFELGLHRTGRFRVAACVENDPAACETLRINRDAGRLDGDLRVEEVDICELDPVSLLADSGVEPGELGVVVGGPPCQSFSNAGKRLGLRDSRGTLLCEYVRVVMACRPKAFLLENVVGLASTPLSPELPKGSLLGWLVREFGDAGYQVDVHTVNAADYGVPQFRRRIFLIGNRVGTMSALPPPAHGDAGSGLLPYRTLAEALDGLVEERPILMDFSPKEREVLAHVPAGGDWRNLPDAVRDGGRPSSGYRRLAWDRPSPTILTRPNRVRTAFCHPAELRPLTAREFARCQGFPDDWEFVGSKESVYRQIGNAVPVQLGEVLGGVVADLLDEVPDLAVSADGRSASADLLTCSRR